MTVIEENATSTDVSPKGKGGEDMQFPLYRIGKGSRIIIDADGTVSKVMSVFEDVYPDWTSERVFTVRSFDKSSGCYRYSAYKERDLSKLMYVVAQRIFMTRDKEKKSLIRDYRIKSVYTYDDNWKPVEVPKEKWKIRRFKQ